MNDQELLKEIGFIENLQSKTGLEYLSYIGQNWEATHPTYVKTKSLNFKSNYPSMPLLDDELDEDEIKCIDLKITPASKSGIDYLNGFNELWQLNNIIYATSSIWKSKFGIPKNHSEWKSILNKNFTKEEVDELGIITNKYSYSSSDARNGFSYFIKLDQEWPAISRESLKSNEILSDLSTQEHLLVDETDDQEGVIFSNAHEQIVWTQQRYWRRMLRVNSKEINTKSFPDFDCNFVTSPWKIIENSSMEDNIENSDTMLERLVDTYSDKKINRLLSKVAKRVVEGTEKYKADRSYENTLRALQEFVRNIKKSAELLSYAVESTTSTTAFNDRIPLIDKTQINTAGVRRFYSDYPMNISVIEMNNWDLCRLWVSSFRSNDKVYTSLVETDLIISNKGTEKTTSGKDMFLFNGLVSRRLLTINEDNQRESYSNGGNQVLIQTKEFDCTFTTCPWKIIENSSMEDNIENSDTMPVRLVDTYSDKKINRLLSKLAKRLVDGTEKYKANRSYENILAYLHNFVTNIRSSSQQLEEAAKHGKYILTTEPFNSAMEVQQPTKSTSGTSIDNKIMNSDAEDWQWSCQLCDFIKLKQSPFISNKKLYKRLVLDHNDEEHFHRFISSNNINVNLFLQLLETKPTLNNGTSSDMCHKNNNIFNSTLSNRVVKLAINLRQNIENKISETLQMAHRKQNTTAVSNNTTNSLMKNNNNNKLNIRTSAPPTTDKSICDVWHRWVINDDPGDFGYWFENQSEDMKSAVLSAMMVLNCSASRDVWKYAKSEFMASSCSYFNATGIKQEQPISSAISMINDAMQYLLNKNSIIMASVPESTSKETTPVHLDRSSANNDDGLASDQPTLSSELISNYKKFHEIWMDRRVEEQIKVLFETQDEGIRSALLSAMMILNCSASRDVWKYAKSEFMASSYSYFNTNGIPHQPRIRALRDAMNTLLELCREVYPRNRSFLKLRPPKVFHLPTFFDLNHASQSNEKKTFYPRRKYELSADARDAYINIRKDEIASVEKKLALSGLETRKWYLTLDEQLPLQSLSPIAMDSLFTCAFSDRVDSSLSYRHLLFSSNDKVSVFVDWSTQTAKLSCSFDAISITESFPFDPNFSSLNDAFGGKSFELQLLNEQTISRKEIERNSYIQVYKENLAVLEQFKDLLMSNDLSDARITLPRLTNINAVSNVGISALHLACVSNDKQLIKDTLDKGADRNLRDSKGNLPVQLLILRSCITKDNLVQIMHHEGFTAPDALISVIKCSLMSSQKSMPMDVITTLYEETNISHDIPKDANRFHATVSLCMIFGTDDLIYRLLSLNIPNIVSHVDKEGNTLLHLAILYDRPTNIITELIELGADINSRNNSGRSPLHLCCSKGKSNTAMELLSYANIDLNLADIDKYTGLHYAVRSCDEKVITALFEGHADIHAKTAANDTLLHIAVKESRLSFIPLLITFGCDINAKNSFGQTILHLAAMSDDVALIELVLSYKMIDINSKDVVNDTALHYSISNKNTAIMSTLLTYNANINVFNSSGKSPIFLAIEMNSEAMFAQLLAGGAIVKDNGPIQARYLHCAIEKNNMTIFRRLLEEGVDIHLKNSSGISPLELAMIFNNEEMALLLVDKGMDLLHICDRSQKKSYLHLAVKKRMYDVINSLVMRDADRTVQDRDMKTPLYLAVELGDERAVKLLIKDEGSERDELCGLLCPGVKSPVVHVAISKGLLNIVSMILEVGEPQMTVDTIDTNKFNCLHIAVINDQFEIVKLLLQKGVDPGKLNHLGQSPLHLAIEKGHKELIDLLVQAKSHVLNEMRLSPRVGKKSPRSPRGNKEVKAAVVADSIVTPRTVDEDELQTDTNSLKLVNQQDNNGETPLHYAIRLNRDDIAIDIITAYGGSVTMRTKDMRTPLHYASLFNRIVVLKALLSNKSNIKCGEMYDSKGYTPLHIAALKGHDEIIDILLYHYSSVEFLEGQKLTLNFNKVYGIKALINLGIKKASDSTFPLIPKLRNALSLAVANCHIPATKLLIAGNADLQLISEKGLMPLHVAVKKQNLELISELQKGKINFNSVSESGDTALHIACKTGKEPLIRSILEKSIDPTNKFTFKAADGIFKDEVGDHRWIIMSPNSIDLIVQNSYIRTKSTAKVAMYEWRKSKYEQKNNGAKAGTKKNADYNEKVDTEYVPYSGYFYFVENKACIHPNGETSGLFQGKALILAEDGLFMDKSGATRWIVLYTLRNELFYEPLVTSSIAVSALNKILEDKEKEQLLAYLGYTKYTGDFNTNYKIGLKLNQPKDTKIIPTVTHFLTKTTDSKQLHDACATILDANQIFPYLDKFPMCTVPLNVNIKNGDEQTPLHIAASVCVDGIVSSLINTGKFELSSTDKNGDTALHVAVKQGRENIIPSLLTDPKIINIQNKSGHTPLHIACIEKFVPIIITLLEYGADPNIKDKKSTLPLAYLTTEKDKVKLSGIFLGHTFSEKALTANSNSLWFYIIQIDDISSIDKKVLQYMKVYPYLAKVKDIDGRVAMDVAKKSSKRAIQSVIFLRERYELDTGPPIHRSMTATVHLAMDHKEGSDNLKKVVLKFMNQKDQFEREKSSRAEAKLDTRYVVDITDDFELGNDDTKNIPCLQDCLSYKYCLVMPAADRNLDAIYRQERPSAENIQKIMKELGQALQSLHTSGLLHGDLKMLNVLRVDGSIRLIDLDAAAKLTDGYACAKFSSAVLPPEVFAILDVEMREKYENYWKEEKDSKSPLWEKIKPIKYGKKNFVVLKTFATEDSALFITTPKSPENLPYRLIRASPTIDIWSFGIMLFNMLSNDVLFKVNRDDDLSVESVVKIVSWTDETIRNEIVSNIKDQFAIDLLCSILQIDPEKRPQSMSQVLAHTYFNMSKRKEDSERFEQVKKNVQNQIALLEVIDNRTAMIAKKTLEITNISDKAFNRIRKIEKVLLRGGTIFDAFDTDIPYCFVILNQKLSINDGKEDVNNIKDVMTMRAEQWLRRLLPLCATSNLSESGDNTITDKRQYLKQFVDELTTVPIVDNSSRSTNDNDVDVSFDMTSFYFYLIDEFTGQPIILPPLNTSDDQTDDIYPIKIKNPQEVILKMLPLMKMSLKAIALNRGISGIARSFGFPMNLLPDHLHDMARNIVGKLDFESAVFEYDELQVAVLESNTPDAKTVRGTALRELSQFYATYDPYCQFSNLLRVWTPEGVSCWASEESVNSMEQNELWHGRYRVLENHPDHTSATCYVFKATDEFIFDESGQPIKVALKLMRNKSQFKREINTRKMSFQKDFVIDVIKTYPEYSSSSSSDDSDLSDWPDMIHIPGEEEDTPEATKIRIGQLTKSQAELFFLVVMPYAERNMYVALKQERFAGKQDLSEVRHIFSQIVKCVDHIHSKGILHGDIKPLNMIRTSGIWKLIDLDAACQIGKEPVGHKTSSAYLPPEAIFADRFTNTVCVKSVLYSNNFSNSYTPLIADPSFDIWALGAFLYHLCTDDVHPLFEGGRDDNLSDDQNKPDNLWALGEWSSNTKNNKLLSVPDQMARNLLSQLLSKNPTMRPSTSRILSHPFLSGKKVARLQGMPATFDIFLSYRVASDREHVEKLYYLLTDLGLKVWWDRICLEAGVDWKQGFCGGLVNSKAFVCLLSRGGINHPTITRQNFSQLKETSPCDNVLLEHRLALELEGLGFIEKIFPVMIGDYDPNNKTFSHFPRSGCAPKVPDVTVTSVEIDLLTHMESQALGTPLVPNRTVLSVYNGLMSHQGAFIFGDEEKTFQEVAQSIKKMITTPLPLSASTSASTIFKTNSASIDIKSSNVSPRLYKNIMNAKDFENDRLQGNITALKKEVVELKQTLRYKDSLLLSIKTGDSVISRRRRRATI